MARSQYGPVVIAVPGAGGTLTSELLPMTVSRTQGGAAETNLQTLAGSPITAPDPDDTTGAASWLGPDGYGGAMWLQDPVSGIWWEVPPVGLAERTLGVSSISVGGAAPQSGAVTLPSPVVNAGSAPAVIVRSASQGVPSAAECASLGYPDGALIFVDNA